MLDEDAVGILEIGVRIIPDELDTVLDGMLEIGVMMIPDEEVVGLLKLI